MNTGKKILKRPLFITGFILLAAVVIIAVFAPWIAPHAYDAQNLSMIRVGPCDEYPLGTDQFGRCILSRIIFGSRIALKVGLLAVVIETLIGVSLGIISGLYGGKIDKLIMFVTDIVWSIPPIVFAMAIVMVLSPSAEAVGFAVAVVTWAQFTKIVRAKVQTIKGLSYIEAAKLYGENDFQIIIRYLLPNLLSTIIILASLALPTAILSTTSMGFLGLGAQEPLADWGMMLSNGIQFLRNAPWICIWPGLAIVWTVLGFNLTAEGAKELLDPRLKV